MNSHPDLTQQQLRQLIKERFSTLYPNATSLTVIFYEESIHVDVTFDFNAAERYTAEIGSDDDSLQFFRHVDPIIVQLAPPTPAPTVLDRFTETFSPSTLSSHHKAILFSAPLDSIAGQECREAIVAAEGLLTDIRHITTGVHLTEILAYIVARVCIGYISQE